MERSCSEDLLGEIHHPAIVGVGGVELHHRELRVVANTDAFIPEVTIDFEDPLETADYESLQVKLGGDAQEHRLIECVVMRHKRLGRSATRDGVQHRCLDFQKPMFSHEPTQGIKRSRTGNEGPSGRLCHDQIDIALTVADFGISQAVELVGQGADRFGDESQSLTTERQFAALGSKEDPFGIHDVAEVPVFEGLMFCSANAVVIHP